MNRQLIEQITARVAAELPEIKKFGLYNDDFAKMDQGTKSAINFPAMFLSFPEPINYIDYGGGNQKTEDFLLRFYIGYKVVNEKYVLEAFDLKQKVYKAFHRWKPEGATSLGRVYEETDESRPGFYIFVQDYSLTLTDSDKWFENGLIEHTIGNLDVEGTAKIAPGTVEKIRTDKKE